MIVTEARARDKSKHTKHTNQHWNANVPTLHRNIAGRQGEHAAARVCSVPVQPATLPAGTDNGIDFYLPDGRSVDAKFTGRSWGSFYLKTKTPLKADLGVLVVPVEREWSLLTRSVCVKAFITREEFERKAKAMPWSTEADESIGVDQIEMHDIELLVGHVQTEDEKLLDACAAGYVRTSDWPVNTYLRDFLASDEGKRVMQSLEEQRAAAQRREWLERRRREIEQMIAARDSVAA